MTADVRERVRKAVAGKCISDAAADAATDAAPAALSDPEVLAGIALALYRCGAYCGGCEYEGWASRIECRQVCTGYAAAVVEWLNRRA